MKVLVVDDNQALLSMVGMLLEGEGHEVVLHESPIQAAFTAREQAFDLLITDICMPQYNGNDLAQNIRLNRINSSVPVLLMSAHPDAEQMMGDLGPRSYFLPKPFSMQEFLTVLERLSEPEVA